MGPYELSYQSATFRSTAERSTDMLREIIFLYTLVNGAHGEGWVCVLKILFGIAVGQAS